MARTIQDSIGTNAIAEAYIGDPLKAAPTRVIATAVYQNAVTEPELDVKAVDTLLLYVDSVKGPATDIRFRVLYGDKAGFSDAEGFQEAKEDNSVPNQTQYEKEVELVFNQATFRGVITIPRLSRFVRIQHKHTGAGDATTLVAVAIEGQRRNQ